ncbi:glutaminyl-peptide cyclotransferase [Pedobacter alpinus]|uniref:Glutaminyl-peptide cyclotransferase n=1 Tax=Pedobacter alpinus TaxID=1590643 RepID=A0ABW5TMX7_9SPHI
MALFKAKFYFSYSHPVISMNYKNIIGLFILSTTFLLFSCNDDKKASPSSSYFTSPESGDVIKAGDEINLKLSFADGLVDSIQYYLDTVKVATKTDTAQFNLPSAGLSLGSRLITAKIYRKGVAEEVTSNVVLLSRIKPKQYGYKIIKTYPHSTTSYVEGLEYHDGVFYESAGDYGNSSLRKVSLDGKVLQQKDVDKQYFAEGMTVIGDKIIQLTYKEKVGFEYDKATFKLLKTFPYNHAAEGWGLTFDGETVYNTDGSNRIFRLDKNTYMPKGIIEVYDEKGPVTGLNELEWIDGKIYANIYTSELIAIINPKTGEVEAYINMMGLPHGPLGDPDQDVLNGIAYDKAGKRLFVTGKKWDKLFHVELVPL